jgi:ABC-type glycerol-3-phosphate transport system substrate-binding protein
MSASQQVEVQLVAQNTPIPADKRRATHLSHPLCKKFPRILAAAMILTMSAYTIVSAGGNKKSEKDDSIQFWHSVSSHNKDVLSSFVDAYNETGRQQNVDLVFQGSEGDLYLKLLTQEDLPEIVLVPIQYMQVLRDRAIIADITPHIPARIKDDIDTRYWDALSIDEGIYGIPFSFHSSLLYVNQHVLRISGNRLEREPDNWEAFVPILQKIRDNTDGKWGIHIPMDTLSHFITYVESYSGIRVVEDQRLTVFSPESVEAMRTLQDMVFDYQVMPPKLTSTEADQLFLSGNLGIQMGKSSKLVYTQTNLPYNLTVWNLPFTKDQPPLLGGSCLAVTSSGLKRVRDVFRLVDFLLNYENSIKWHTRTGSPAILQSARESIDLLIFYEENPNYMTSIIALDRGTVFAPRYDYYSIDSVMRGALDRIMINGEDPYQILSELQGELDLMIIPSM